MSNYEKAVVKFNGGKGALLCQVCNKVIATGMIHEDKEHLCDTCSWLEIIHFLTGSCNSLDEALQIFEKEELADHQPFLQYLDDEIFLCDSCSWWCPLDEQNRHDELVCCDCHDETIDE